jgi:hypothetical protein
MKQPAERLSKMATATRYPSKIEFDESNMNLALKDAKLIVETMFAAIDRRIEKEENKTNEASEKTKPGVTENLNAMKKILNEKADEQKKRASQNHDSR